MKTLIPIVILLSLASCVTQKRCYQKFPPQVVTIRHDSIVIKDSLVYRDRLVPYKIPGDTVWKEKPIPGIPEKINVPPMKLENLYAEAQAWIENSMLKMSLRQKDQVINFRLDSADKERSHWEYLYKNEKQTITLPPVKYTPKFWLITGCCFIGLIVAGIGILIFKFFIK
jgi:hypothetical protein